MDSNEMSKSVRQCGSDDLSPQFGRKKLSALKQDVQNEAMELFSKAALGGMVGLYLEEGLPLYFMSDQLLNNLEYTYEELIANTNGFFINTIHTDDRAQYSLELEEALRANNEFEIVSRVLVKNGYRYMRDIGKKIIGENGRPALMILRMDVTQFMDCKKTLEEKVNLYEEKSRELANLIESVPGGICQVAMDDEFTLLYGNDSFYTFYGYTPEQMRKELACKLIKLFYCEDRERVKQSVIDALQEKKKGFEIEHRLVRRNGIVLWILVKGNFFVVKNETIINCVVIDITDRKRIEQELKINEERFRIALASTDNTIFDYDIRARVMVHGEKSAEDYGLTKITENVPESLVKMGVIHKDSTADFLGMYGRIRNGDKMASCVVQVRILTGEYVWRKISMTAIFDEDDKAVRAIGVLEDIDSQMKREEKLRYQSERDTLTNLYNKGATELRVKESLDGQNEESINALFIIDIDKFKEVNDKYGHMFGDYVLMESAARISRLFHGQDVIGRIGGDEFIVYMSKLPSAETAYKRAGKICASFRQPFVKNNICTQVSSSIGIAFCPINGSTFEELYQKADIALYEAKKNGKNRYEMYQPGMISASEWVPYSRTAIDTLARLAEK